MTAKPDETEDERDPDSTDTAEPDLTKDEIFHILQNDRRRGVLRFMQDTDDPVRMRDVAEQVAAWEHDTTVQRLSSKERQRVYIPLYQSHLPKLDQAGVIDYQQSRGIVERKPLADVFDPYLAVESDPASGPVTAKSLRRDDHFLAAAAIGGVLLLGSVLEVPILGTLSGVTVAIVLLVLLMMVTAKRHIRP